MGKPIKKPRKHIPQRTCVGCREVQGKRSMVRLVRTDNGVVLDASGKLPGRGAYLHIQQDCITKGISGAIARALKIELHEDNLNQLKDLLQIQLNDLQQHEGQDLSKQ
jgi:uncharacterized protein